MNRSLSALLKTATFKQTALTSGATIINGVLGALFYIFLARLLGPSEFGLIILSITTLTYLADIADLGINSGIIRFIPGYLQSDKQSAYRFLKLSIEIKVIISFVIFGLGWLSSSIVATNIFLKPDLAPYLRLVSLGVGGALLFSYATSSLQALQRFKAWSLLNIGSNLLRLVIIIWLAGNFALGGLSSLSIYILVPLLSFWFSLFLLPTKNIFFAKDEIQFLGKAVNYNKWIALFALFAASSSRIDTFLTGRLLSEHDLGLYGAANQLVSVIPQLTSAIGAVAAPKFASFTSDYQMWQYLKKLQLMVVAAAIITLLMLPVINLLIPIIYGAQYLESVIVFDILLISMLVFLISIPIHNSILYYFSYPKLFSWMALGHLGLVSILGYLLITNYGVIGAATSVLLGMIFNLVIPLTWIISRKKQ